MEFSRREPPVLFVLHCALTAWDWVFSCSGRHTITISVANAGFAFHVPFPTGLG